MSKPLENCEWQYIELPEKDRVLLALREAMISVIVQGATPAPITGRAVAPRPRARRYGRHDVISNDG